jgi:hypothetical protein
VEYNIQTGKKNIKLLMEYENVTQTVLLFIESIVHDAKTLQHARLPWHVRYSSGIQFLSLCSPHICGVTVSIGATILHVSFISSREVKGVL